MSPKAERCRICGIEKPWSDAAALAHWKGSLCGAHKKTENRELVRRHRRRKSDRQRERDRFLREAMEDAPLDTDMLAAIISANLREVAARGAALPAGLLQAASEHIAKPAPASEAEAEAAMRVLESRYPQLPILIGMLEAQRSPALQQERAAEEAELEADA